MGFVCCDICAIDCSCSTCLLSDQDCCVFLCGILRTGLFLWLPSEQHYCAIVVAWALLSYFPCIELYNVMFNMLA